MRFFFNNLLFQLTIFQICLLIIFINGNVLKRDHVDTVTEATVDPSAVVVSIEMGNFVNLPTVFVDNSSKKIINDDIKSNNLNSVTYNLVNPSNIDTQGSNIVENNTNNSAVIIGVNIIPSETLVPTILPSTTSTNIITSTTSTTTTTTTSTTTLPSTINETNIMFIETSTTTTSLPSTEDTFGKITLDAVAEENASMIQLITKNPPTSDESNILNDLLPTDPPPTLKPTKAALGNEEVIHNSFGEVSTNYQKNVESKEAEEPEDVELCLGNRHLLPRIVVNSLEKQKRKLSRLINRINEQQKQHCRPDRSRYQVEYHKCPLWRSEKMAYFYQYMRLVYCDDYDKYPESNKFKRTYGPQISLYEKMYAFHQQKI
ncbi:Hypothetical protein SRAE_2000417600 [Strongyloides ratti]|uniref:Uncharacterized protein n=1 Tax=Strongyloides ratti TaxID=34506 RepID=A0A090LMX9_STRRB|nr:Hypothetical protein SRAE_2000417600 [Strongyloides ratti]CEF69528.1 Hypothetical protein SRAE_2000417600 [Strongyloides ratti]